MMAGKEVKASDAGFSLIELIITVSILLILSGLFFLGTNVSRRKETDKYVAELTSQIRMIQTTSMAKAGRWRLCLYEKNGDYYCVQEREAGAEGGTGQESWEIQGEKITLGHSGAVDYRLMSAVDPEGTEKEEDASDVGGSDPERGSLIHIWRFNRDTGACIEGAGTIEVTGISKMRYISVYRENGYCEVRNEK